MKLDARHAALAVLLSLSVAYHIVRLALSVSAIANPSAHPFVPFELKVFSAEVTSARPEAAAAGLQAGDRILRLGGRALRGYGDIGPALSAARSSGVISIEVERGGAPLSLTVPVASPPAAQATLAQIGSVAILDFVLPAFLLSVGFVVAWFKPRDRAAWILLFMMLCFSNLGREEIPFAWLGPWPAALLSFWMAFLTMSWAPSIAAFALAFPEPFPSDRRFPWIKWLLFGPLLLSAFLLAATSARFVDFGWGAAISEITAPWYRAILILTYGCVSLFFWTLGMKIGNGTRLADSKNLDSLRRLKILLAGAFLGLTPAGIIATIALVKGRSFGSSVPEALQFAAVLMMLIFPLTLAYVVIVHKAMGIGSAIRQGLRYALAQRAIRIVQVVTGIVVVWGLLDIVSDPSQRRVDRLRSMGLAVLFMVLFQRGAERLKRWIDRRFFREAVDAEQVLADLGERVRLIADRHDLLAMVSQTISSALHVPKIAAFVRGDAVFAPAFATGYGALEPGPEFDASTGLTRSIAALQKPQTIYLDDQRSWTRRENVPEPDTAKLRALESEVLIPLRTKNALEGFLSLGPKASEAAYSPSDLHLLQSVAHQTALALDNTRLVEQVASEIAKRERLTREIEIAREVQFTLLPQEAPTIERLDLAGYCRPAAGVGGDYYDFIPLDGERSIGLAIGDIAGKGIPAALLMAGLQAALRGQALAGSRDLARLMTNINKLIFESSPANRYATFFYGEFRQGRFAYVNAGHNAPILLRRDGRVERLDAGGPVIGLMDVAPFSESAVDIGPGDVLLGYTDGVSECMNPRDEEWSDDEVIRILEEGRQTASAEIVSRVMTAADAFANGAKQHDDMTLIVMKVS